MLKNIIRGSSRLLKNDFLPVVASTYWITGDEQSQYVVVAQGAERVFQQPARVFSLQLLFDPDLNGVSKK